MDNILSIAAIILSILSLLLSVYVTWKDRGRLKIYAHPVKHPDTDEYSFTSINVVNTGRRVVLMKYFVGEYFDGSTARYCLNSTCEVVVLTEGQDFKYKLGKFDGPMVNMRDENQHEDSEIKNCLFEDTMGKKWKVKGAKSALKTVRMSSHKFGIRTHY
ncbi:hypothetical protein D8T36_22315 [Vibrio vulnificus]|uniref:hypothetical protein n=1 Tax=Vibrio vulnificus TaxID=672 RepID=UPI0010236F62|nr:hypothetical protein [Vibrio vulnificus]RZQ19024.1 hypothetical protein D8T36_22315 [Vibrio vulnificus]